MFKGIRTHLALFAFVLLAPVAAFAAPTITSITPNTGNNWGMVQIENLAGTGFEEGARVTLTREGQDDILMYSTIESSTKISGGFDPMGAEVGAWDLVVTNSDGESSTLAGGFTLSAPPAPIITGNFPGLADNMGYVEVDVQGENFLDGAQVKLTREGLADIDAIFVMLKSDTKILCEFDLTGVELGQWSLMVINPDGQSATLNSIDVTQWIGSEVFYVATDQDFYVDAVNGNNANDGLTPATAWQTITYALNHVSGTGITVSVAAGTYNPPLGETFPIRMRNGVSLIGAGEATTILDAQGTNTVIYCDNIGTGTAIEGFTITNGNDPAGWWPSSGGIYCYYSSPAITNCIISGNTAPFGGGISCNYSSPTITNCTINGNTAGRIAGGIFCYYSSPTITNCTISGNTAMSAGGISCYIQSSPIIINCTISGNSANHGGGIYPYFYSSPIITNCTISNNSSVYYGGGMYSSYASPIITNCTISDNTAGLDGGGMYDNGSYYRGGTSRPIITNCTISNNSAGRDGGGIYCYRTWPTVKNSILWGDSPNEISLYTGGHGSSITITYSDIQGGWTGTGNINADPLFVDPANGDYHLQPGSPCINTGTLTDAPEYDFEGDPRLASVGGDDMPDMGADESACNFYYDADGDSYGDYNISITPGDCLAPSGYAANNTDCDDTDPAINPGVTEICDAIDNNCDGQIDEGFGPYYYDADGDGYGDPNDSYTDCSPPAGYILDNTDCDDIDPAINPGATEVCDGVDNDCDGQIDQGLLNTYYRDADGDAYGDPYDSLEACSAPTGYILNNTDCDDGSPYVNPGATEVCNNIDDNCDGRIDEGFGVGYNYDDTVLYSWEEISGTGSRLYLGDDSYSSVSLPFSFTLFEQSFNRVLVGSNGQISFVDEYFSRRYWNQCLPTSGTNNPFIAAFWDDLNPSRGGTIYWQIKGTAPNRRLIVEWSGIPHYWRTGNTTFQVILYEGTNDILIQYADVYFGTSSYDRGRSATAGIQGNPSEALQYSCNSASLDNGLAILFYLGGCDNTPPVADAGADQTIECSSPSGASVTLDGTGSYDLESDPLTYFWSTTESIIFDDPYSTTPTSIFPLGATTVTLEVDDGNGGTDTDEVLITVQDTIPPSSSATPSGTLGNNGWYVSNVTVELTASDTGSGVSQIRYSIDGGAEAVYTAPFSLTTDGGHSISYYAVDNAGNQEAVNSLTVNIDKTPPVADAVVIFSREACLSTICAVTLDGSGSNDINGIVSYDWYEDYGTASEVLLGSGASLTLDLELGEHQVTLLVTDTAGNTAQVSIVVSVEPALLSLFKLEKAEVEWEKNKLKFKGKLSLPVGKLLSATSPIGAVYVDLPVPLGQVVAQSVNFTVKDNGEKWKYKDEAATLGLRKFKVDWEGAKFEYKQTIHIEAEHLGDTSTTLEIEREDVVGAFSVLVGGITISVDAANNVTVSPPEGVVIDLDDDGEVEVELPFALTSDMTLIISGAVADTVLVSDYYTPAIGKFKIEALFDPGSVDVGSLTPTLFLEVNLGEEGFPGIFGIGSLDWKYADTKEWKYKLEN